mmetsp:Transcript_44513/g.127015  ORF Transcript_44513/g.127015 Transcript_44513/m.127015 type:complete len:281 (-) Transcript_44513:789-1631(-)
MRLLSGNAVSVLLELELDLGLLFGRGLRARRGLGVGLGREHVEHLLALGLGHQDVQDVLHRIVAALGNPVVQHVARRRQPEALGGRSVCQLVLALCVLGVPAFPPRLRRQGRGRPLREQLVPPQDHGVVRVDQVGAQQGAPGPAPCEEDCPQNMVGMVERSADAGYLVDSGTDFDTRLGRRFQAQGGVASARGCRPAAHEAVEERPTAGDGDACRRVAELLAVVPQEVQQQVPQRGLLVGPDLLRGGVPLQERQHDADEDVGAHATGTGVMKPPLQQEEL